MAVKEQNELDYWDRLAFEATKEKEANVRIDKWRNAARNWLAHYSENKARNFVLQTIENYVKPRGDIRILDVGCGPGKWVNLFAERGFSTVGIDSSPWMIRLAKRMVRKDLKGLVKFYVMDAADLNLPNDSYDLVSCITVLQHIFNDKRWRKAIHEIVRVTKPLGYILIFDAAPSFTLKKRTRHLRFRTMKEYVRAFSKAGAYLTYWRATDLSFPVTFLGLRKYAASFERKVYYFFAGGLPFFSNFLSLLSRIAVILAKPIDHKLGGTPLSFLSIGKILLFIKAKT